MMRNKFSPFLILLLWSGLSQAGNMLLTDHVLVGKLWDMNSRSYISEAQLLARLATTDLLLLGETHDNPTHHEYQQQLLQARIASGARPTLMMEQLNAEDQVALDQALADSDREQALLKVKALVKFSNAQDYHSLLANAVDNNLPIIAANVSNQQLRPAIWRGYASYDAHELQRLMIEPVWSDSRQHYLVNQMGGVHCGKLNAEMREGLTRSQRLRDAMMADSALASLADGVVAIVGSGHARRDIGLPLYFAARAPEAKILSIGFMEVSEDEFDPQAYVTDSATGVAPFDVIWFTSHLDRVDPCANIHMPQQKVSDAT